MHETDALTHDGSETAEGWFPALSLEATGGAGAVLEGEKGGWFVL